MAKDPAFLFYPGDWLGGTISFSRSQKGAYIDLLMAQFNQGRLHINDIKDVLGTDFDSMWERKLKAKFKQDEKLLFYNSRLDEEQSKRKNYTQSRRNNKHTVSHMTVRMEDENENRDKNKKEDGIIYPFESKEFSEAFELWIKYKKEQFNFTYKPIGLQGCLKDICDLSMGVESRAIELIHYAIKKGWKGIYEIKDSKNGNTKATTRVEGSALFREFAEEEARRSRNT